MIAENEKRKLIVLTGPTSVGKTKLSLRLAKMVGGEIISADSMQVYRHMNIGTAKIRPEEMEDVPHHLIDCLNPDEEFNVSVFQQMALQAMEGIYERGHIPIVTGGTGFYIQALLKNVSFDEEERNDGYREKLEQIALQENGTDLLYQELLLQDKDAAEAIPKQNVKRVIRALEFKHYHGYCISEHNRKEALRDSDYQFAYFVLQRNRDELYRRIDERVDMMMEQGLLQEIMTIKDLGYADCTVSMQGLGYKQMLAFLNGECTLEEAVYRIKLETRHFAKRQMTWFRREKDCIFFNLSDMSEDDVLQEMARILKEKLIISGECR